MAENVRHWNSKFQGRKQNKEVAKNYETKKSTKSKEPQSLEEALTEN